MTVAHRTASLPADAVLCRATGWQVTPDDILWRRVDLDDTARFDRAELLDSAERQRASRFRFAVDRDRFVAAHVALRMALSEVLHEAPEAIAIATGAHGKPRLVDEHRWAFNLSHSGGIGLIAVAHASRASRLGIDVEIARPIEDWHQLASACFSQAECDALVSMPASETSAAFLRCWTRKEACVKAIGAGLTVPTNSFTAGVRGDMARTSIVFEGRSRRLAVRTLFEDDCIGAMAWCEPDAPDDGDVRFAGPGPMPEAGANEMHSRQESHRSNAGRPSWT